LPGWRCCGQRPGSGSTAVFGLTPSKLNLVASLLVLIAPMQIASLFRRFDTAQGAGKQVPLPVICIFCVIVTTDVWLMITFAAMTQRGLSVPVRNAMLAAGVLLTPIAEIFQFLEDVVTVKITAAVGAKDWKGVRDVLTVGIVGGMTSGVVAAGCISLACLSPQFMRAMLAPFSFGSDWAMHVDECSLVPHAVDVVAIAQPFVLVSAWAWPFRFTNMALTGFLISTGFWKLFFILSMVEKGIAVVGLYVYFLPHPSLLTLGWIGFTGSCVATLGTLALMVLQKPVRDLFTQPGAATTNPQNNEACAYGASSDGESMTAGDAATTRASSKISMLDWLGTASEGLMAMVADLAVQIPQTVGVYMAGIHLGIGAMYQISSLQAAFPQYGTSWVQGMAIGFKIIGAIQLGAGDFEGFAQYFSQVVVYVFMLSIVAFASTWPFAEKICFELADQACVYASEPGCLSIYQSIFGGGNYKGDTLQGNSFKAFVPALCATCFYRAFKAGLYACQDFRFMAMAGLVSFICGFLPFAFVVAHWHAGAMAVLIAMYLPCFILAIAFAARTRANIRRMRLGIVGPWNTYGRESDASCIEGSDESESSEDDRSGG